MEAGDMTIPMMSLTPLWKILFRYGGRSPFEICIVTLTRLHSYLTTGDMSLVPDDLKDRIRTPIRMRELREISCIRYIRSYFEGLDDECRIDLGGDFFLYYKDVDTLLPTNTINDEIQAIVDGHYSSLGFVWDGYVGYFNSEHPLFKAWTGELPLNKENFERCYKITGDSSIFSVEFETRSIPLDHRGTHDYCGRGCGWDSKTLKSAIMEHLGGIPHTPEGVPFPGFGVQHPGNEGDDNVLPRIREVNALIDELDCVSDSEKWTELTEELADLGSDYFGVRERKVLWEDDMLPGFYVSIYNDLIKDD